MTSDKRYSISKGTSWEDKIIFNDFTVKILGCCVFFNSLRKSEMTPVSGAEGVFQAGVSGVSTDWAFSPEMCLSGFFQYLIYSYE